MFTSLSTVLFKDQIEFSRTPYQGGNLTDGILENVFAPSPSLHSWGYLNAINVFAKSPSVHSCLFSLLAAFTLVF